MAELDDKLIQNLNQRLQTMESLLSNLTKTLGGVKEGMVSAFNPAIVKSWSDSIKGLKTIRLIDAEKAKTDIKEINDMVRVLTQEQKHGRVFTLFTEEEYNAAIKRLANLRVEIENLNRKAKSKEGLSEDEALIREALRQQRDSLYMATRRGGYLGEMLSPQQMAEVNDQLAKYKALQTDIAKGSERRAAELANLKRNEELNALKQEAQLNKEIAEEEKKRTAEARQRYAEAQAANKALNKEQDALEKRQRSTRVAESKSAWKADVAKQVQNEQKMNQAIQQQIQYYRQLHTLYKGYKDLQAKPNKTKEDIAILEQTKQKILEILRLSKQLELENKGSRQAGINATSFQRLADNLRNASKETKTLKANLNNLLPTLHRLASAFGVAFSVRGLAQFGKKLIETRGEFERQQVALRSILQNKQLADEIWDKTMQAALQSPFTAMQLTTYTKQLAAYRIETDKLFDTTKRLADVSAGLGVDMQRLILAYGQVKAANYLRASEIRQFTEAGVNILGELSQYFTETREGMYDTAKVMDMVTKRMVKFEDVEAIFKRMTDQGGIFYEMQYVQSQTVKGQIAKLHDAYDQMLNSIGRANEGVLKDMVSLLNSIVNNWRTWAVVLKSIAWGAVIGYLSKFALPLMGIGKASVSTLRSIVRLRQGVQSLGASLKANLPMLGIFAATAVITALNNLRKKMNEVNKEIDEQNLRLYETRQNFEGMKSKIEENNRILKTAGSKTEDLNKAQKENESIMQRLRNEYPQLADQMQIATNGIIDMNDALDANIRKLNEQMTVLNAMKQGNWFSDSDQKNLADWQGALATMKTTLIAAQSEARKKVMQMELGGETDEPLYDIYKKVADIDLSGNILDAVSAFNLLNGEVLAYQSNLYKGTPTRSESLYSILGIKVGNLQANWSENRVKDVLDRLAPTLQSYYENGIKDNADFLKEINEQYGGNVTQFIQANAEKINQATLDGLNNANSILINTLKPQTAEMKTFLNQELNRLFGTTGIDYFSTSTKGTTPTKAEPEGDKQSKIDAAWRRRINLIEEMKKRYDELSKSAFGYAKSEDSVRKAFDDSFAEIFKGTSIDISQIDFTSMSGMMESMKVLLEKAKGVSDSVREELMKKIDSFEAQITIDAQVRIREDFGKQMEKAFGDYELTLDIEKLNLPSDVLANMFDIESIDLAGLRKKIEEGYERLRGENGGNVDETDRKNIEGYIKKIDEMERKQQRERIKDYAKYLEYEMSERAKITMEYVRKISDVQAETSFSSKQKERIVKGLTKEMNEKLAKQDWDDFKGSEVYVQMMEDLEKHGSAALVTMRKELEKIRDNAENLSPRALKEVVNALAKIKEIELNRSNPFTALNQSRVDMQNAISKANAKSREEVYAEADAIEKEIVAEQGRKREIENIVSARKEGLRIEEELSKLYSRNNILDYAVTPTDKDDFVQSNINALQAAIKANVSEIENLQTERAKEGTTEERVRQIDDEIGSIIEETNQYREQKEILEKILQLRISLGLIDKNAIQDEDAERRQAESETKLENLAEEQRRYQEAVDAIDRYNAQVQRAMQFVDEWAGKVQGLWGEISNLSTAYEGEFGDWVAKWGNVIDVSLSQVSKLSKAFADFRKTRADYLKSAVKKTTDKVSNAAETAQTATTTLATNAETEAITANTLAKTENAVASNLAATGNTAVGTTATAATPAVATFGATLLMAMGWVGLIIAALEALFVIIKAIAGANDEGIDQKIEDSKDKVDKLTKAYERLEKQIEKTWDTVSYMREYNEEVQNLQQQIEEANNQIAAAQGYKNEDKKKEAIEAAEDAKQEALDALDEIKQKQIEVFGGIGEDGYRDAAQGFVDAWKSAFLETGDGLQGLQDHFDEFLNDWFVKQATMRIAANNLEPLFRKIDQAVDQNGLGGANVTWQELQEINDLKDLLLTQTNEQLKELSGVFGLGGEGSLSGLAAGIQGMTEEQANILEAYWNSVRGYTASIDMNVARIAQILGAGGDSTNPQLQQLSLIAANTQATHQLLQSVTKSGHSQGGYGIKVFAD